MYLLQFCGTDFIEQCPSSFTKVLSGDCLDLITVITVNGKKGAAIHINGAERPSVTGGQTRPLAVNSVHTRTGTNTPRHGLPLHYPSRQNCVAPLLPSF